jgi:hypothetical protein
MEEREVERIKCMRCHHTTKDFEVSRTFFTGKDGCEISEAPYCPLCKSHRVLEVIGSLSAHDAEEG